MSEIRRIQPPDLVDSRPSGFAQVVSTRGERLIFVSGQVAIDKEGRLVGRGDVGAQTHQVLTNIEAALRAASARMEDVVKLTIYVVDYKPSDRAKILEARQRYFAAEKVPASTLVGVQALVADGYLIEIEAIAVVG